jgi:hypothetical protein
MHDQMQISPQAEDSLQRLQDVSLSPMEEALFKAWTKANQIDDPDTPGDIVDYRGIWKASGGLVLPHGELKRDAEMQNHQHKLQRELQQRMMDRMNELVGKQEDFQKDQFKAERQDITHRQKMEQGDLKLKQSPFDLKMKEHAIKGQELGLEKQRMGIDQAKIGNEGKELDLLSALLQPSRPQMGQTNDTLHSNSGDRNRKA